MDASIPTRSKILRIAAAGLLLFAAVGGAWYMSEKAAPGLDEMVSLNAFNTLRGTVYLTLVEKGDNAPDLFTLDMESLEIERSFDEADYIRVSQKVSPDGTKSAYVGAQLDRSSPYAFASREYFQVQVRDTATGEMKVLTDSDLLYKRLGEWSPDGTTIAFTALAPSKTNAFRIDPEEWSVHTVDLNGATTTVDSGTYPFWSPDGTRILYMKSDGLYIYDAATEQKVRVFPSLYPTTSVSMKLDVSDDGKKIVWSQLGRIYVLDIDSWEKGTVLMNRIIRTGKNVMYSPIISPYNRYVIYKEADYNPSGDIVNPNIVAYDLQESTRRVLLPLDQYDFELSFFSDWK
jgi:Tol biopolymer transport system component